VCASAAVASGEAARRRGTHAAPTRARRAGASAGAAASAVCAGARLCCCCAGCCCRASRRRAGEAATARRHLHAAASRALCTPLSSSSSTLPAWPAPPIASSCPISRGRAGSSSVARHRSLRCSALPYTCKLPPLRAVLCEHPPPRWPRRRARAAASAVHPLLTVAVTSGTRAYSQAPVSEALPHPPPPWRPSPRRRQTMSAAWA
jgi:hypothetical protein